MGWIPRHCACRLVHYRGSVEQVRPGQDAQGKMFCALTVIYVLCFVLHFSILENSGPGDAQMSSLFQANLRGTEVGKDSPLELAYGSRATLKNMGYGGGLLHSHVQTYPQDSSQNKKNSSHNQYV